MYLYDAIIDTWELAGEPSDLDPFAYDTAGDIALDGNGNYIFDTASKGYRYFIQQFNRAQIALANWRRKNGRFVKFKKFFQKFQVTLGTDEELDGVLNIETSLFTFSNAPEEPEKYLEDLFLVVDTDNVQTFDNEEPSNYREGDLWIQSGVYRRANVARDTFLGTDWYIVEDDSLSEEYLRVQGFIDNGDGTWTLSFSDGSLDALEGFKNLSVKGRLFSFRIEGDIDPRTRSYFLEMPRWPYYILNISYQGSRLNRTEDRESLYEPTTGGQAPDMFVILGNKVYFDVLFEGKYTLEFEVYAMPPVLETYEDEFSIPQAYHECLTTWVEWRLAKRQQEFQKAYAIKRDLIDQIEWTMSEEEFEFMQETLGNFQVFKE